MRALFRDAAIFDGDDPRRGADRRQPMRDDEHCPALGDLAHILLDHIFGLIIERAGGFVEDQNARIGDQCPGDGDALALSMTGRMRFTRPP